MFRTVALCAGLMLSTSWTLAAQEVRSDLFSQQPGRFQIIFNPSIRADTFLLDTGTGKVWQLTKFTDLKNDPVAWVYMDRLDDGQEVLMWAKDKAKPQEKNPASATPSLRGNPRPQSN